LMENKNKMYVKKVVNIYIYIYGTRQDEDKRRLNCYAILYRHNV
jgi:hypothetical protein